MLFITSSLQNQKKKPNKKEERQVSALPLALVVEKKLLDSSCASPEICS